MQITKNFVIAGKAIFTIKSGKSGQHWTYKVVGKPDRRHPGEKVYFVNYLYGPDNLNDYRYLGMLNPRSGQVHRTNKSGVFEDAPVFVAVKYTMQLLWADKMLPEGYSISGMGMCGRCGLPLTRPEGIEETGFRFGFGPTCWKTMGGKIPAIPT